MTQEIKVSEPRYPDPVMKAQWRPLSPDYRVHQPTVSVGLAIHVALGTLTDFEREASTNYVRDPKRYMDP